MPVTVDKLLNKVLLHTHKAGDILSAALVDTKANILATTPSEAGKLAYATDIDRLMIFDGSEWKITPLKLGSLSSGVDAGSEPYYDDSGYAEELIDNKELHNIVITGFSRQPRPGAIRFNISEDSLQIYTLSKEWKNLRALTDDEISAIILWGIDWEGKDEYDNSYIHGHKIDKGVFATYHKLTGGTF